MLVKGDPKYVKHEFWDTTILRANYYWWAIHHACDSRLSNSIMTNV